MSPEAAASGVLRAGTIRAQNSELVVSALREGGPKTRAELSTLTSLTPQALGPILQELSEAGLVQSRVETRSGPGRPPMVYEFNTRSSYDADIVYLFDWISVVLSDAAGEVITRQSIEAASVEAGPDLVTPWGRALSNLLEAHDVKPSQLASVNVSILGTIDEEALTIVSTPRCRERDIPLGDLLRPFLGDDTVLTLSKVDKAAAAAAAVDTGPDELVALLVLGFLPRLFLASDGKLLDDRRDRIGDLQHIPVPGNHRQCECGRIGCVATVFAAAALDRYRQAVHSNRPATLKELIDSARTGDVTARLVVDDAFRELASGMCGLMTYLDVDRLTIIGPRQMSTEHIAVLFREVFAESYPDLPIKAAEVANEPGAQPSPAKA